MYSVSVVIHDRLWEIDVILEALSCLDLIPSQVILTLNKDTAWAPVRMFPFELVVIRNQHAKGFGENHNAAFEYSVRDWFLILNPDVSFSPSFSMRSFIESAAKIDACLFSPQAISPSGCFENNGRSFPTLWSVISKAICLPLRSKERFIPPSGANFVDWLSGAFMLVRHEDFRAVEGFDEAFFMYFEDVDLCARLEQALERSPCLLAQYTIIHSGARQSRRNIKYAFWFFLSMTRFFGKRFKYALSNFRP